MTRIYDNIDQSLLPSLREKINNSMYFNETPKRGEKTHINLRFTQERISEQDLEVQVEQFLRSVEDSI